MKTLKKHLTKNWPLLIAVGFVLSFSSCKKSDTNPVDNSVSAADAVSVTNAVAATADDASIAADGSYSRGGGVGNPWVTLCGGTATVDSATQTITIVHNDDTVPCNGVYRSGTATITLTGGSWRTQGATITVATTGLKITDAVTLGYYTISGSHEVINESGGVLADLITSPSTPITRRHKGNLQITFANNSQRTWTFDRTRSWSTFSSGGTTYLNASLYTEAAGNVEASGEDRFGQTFTDLISSPIQADNYKCSGEARWNAYTGTASHNLGARTVSISFGTNSAGTSVGTNTYCPSTLNDYGYYITYTNSNSNRTLNKFISYWYR